MSFGAQTIFGGVLALLLSSIAGDAWAQCADKPSSCLQCHETRGHRSTRDDGSAWHRDHAIGDFCSGCHGGDPAADGEADAHAAMLAPLASSERACASCHASNHRELAARYDAAGPARRGAQPPPAPAADPRRGDTIAGALAALIAVAGAVFVAWNELRRGGDALARGRAE